MITLSRPFTKEDVIQNKKSAIRALNKQLEYYINDPSGNHLKKANLISYWLKDYVRMINYEEKFNPTRNIAYKRGNIIKLNFGFNIGSEYGGLHYAVVLDKHNAHHSPVVTVVPLTSIKQDKTIHENNIFLGNDIYRLLKIKHDTVQKALLEEQAELKSMITIVGTLVSLTEKTTAEANALHAQEKPFDKKLLEAMQELEIAQQMLDDLTIKRNENNEKIINLEKIEKEISQMKEGSIALINQITTVSKIRIYDPKNLNGVLSGITLSQEQMEKINNKIKDLYIF